MKNELKFKVSSALKDIIGRDLITDDLIAVFELVKNSYDAYATRVDIIFEKNENGNNRIIIKDNGKGMDFNDLKNKWLFVAYSAKRDGSEDENFDYRDKINSNKAFAGAKGIGRFSCDRLGKTLLLETTKNEQNPKTEVLFTDWEKFEDNLKDEFIDVKVDHETIGKSNFGLKNGTVLVIENLRNEWDRGKLLKLKDSLAKLINPNIDSRSANFSIYIEAKEELQLDAKQESYRQKVNGEVKNFIFETLELKTTKITTSVTDNGNFTTTEIIDGGTLIYKIKEENKFSLLNGIDITLFYLNRSAKLTFTKRMGISSKDYGHIFLYKNGFRVYPFGEPGEDPLKIDVRKAQGYNRFLGTRDLIGQIEINHNSDELKETSSRGDGLIKTNTYFQLEEFFWESLKRLEKYVVEVQKWGLSIENKDDSENIESRITDLIAKISGTTELVDIEYNKNFLDILSKSQEGSVESIINNLNRLALKSKNEKLINESKKASKVLNSIKVALISAEDDVEEQRKVIRKKDKELIEKDSENLFLKSVKSQDFDEVVSFLHHIGISSKNIDNELKLFVKKLKKGKEIKPEDLISKLESILFENRKIISISKFASKANFKLYTANKELDIVNYISEYVKNILGLVSTQDPKVVVKSQDDISFVKDIKPIELNIIIDNLISNSRRAKAKKIEILLSKPNSDCLEIKFTDNGNGIKKENQEKIFEMGYTTTSGSGIGLFHIKKILNEMGSTIELNSMNKSLTEFLIKIYK